MTVSKYRRIACVHLYDDYSGSTNVFAQVLSLLEAEGHRLTILVADLGEAGFVRSNWSVSTVPYSFHRTKWRAAVSYLYAQVLTFLKVLWLCLFKQHDLVYVNTILPAGAILAGRLCRRPVIVHSHEVGIGTKSLFEVARAVARRFATRIVCVSRFVADTVGWPSGKTVVIHNSMSDHTWKEARNYGKANLERPASEHFRCAMACSLRPYKGIDSFLLLATAMPEVDFDLILNCEAAELRDFLGSTEIPRNVNIHRRPSSVLRHFAQADLVLNLSHADACIETFGMTLLESMACAVPVIAPKVGGCLDLFKSGNAGWHIDSRDLIGLTNRINVLKLDPSILRQARQHAFENANLFSPNVFAEQIAALFRNE